MRPYHTNLVMEMLRNSSSAPLCRKGVELSSDDNVRTEALVDLANMAYERNFRNLRQFYIDRLRKKQHVPLFGPNALYADNYTNYHTLRRWNKALQRIEVRISDSSDRYKRKDLVTQDESIRYRHWLETTHRRNFVGDGFTSVVCRPTRSLRGTWRSKPYELLDQSYIDAKLGRS
jgi:hypothetical protein